MSKRDPMEYITDRIIAPMVVAEKLRSEGMEGVEVALVATTVEVPGFIYEVQCFICGAKAKLPFDPGDREGICPDCVKLVP